MVISIISQLVLFLAWYKGYSIIPALFAPGYKLQPGVTGVFASDRTSPIQGYFFFLLHFLLKDLLLNSTH